ncbi:MAG: GPW/gp25 family protein [Burkholderiales bacterium]|nr:GPW/gp25 family protein [Burkholderiales bacterium]
MTRRLADPPYLAFPLRLTGGTPRLATRIEHVRGQIEQVLHTLAGERVFRPEFGAGVKALLFEPNAMPLWQVAQRRLAASLTEALAGEVDPRSLEVSVQGREGELDITIAYTLATIGRREEQSYRLRGG